MIEAARAYFERGWTAIPLGLDPSGKPKRPIDLGWQHTPHRWDAIERLSWSGCVGIGIVLGPESGNLAVIDLDNNDLAAVVFALLRENARQDHCWVTTGRNNGHLYLVEESPSHPQNFWIDWKGTQVKIELKARGQQVAAPPTPGYASVWGDTPFLARDGIRGVWNALAARLGLPVASDGISHGSGNFPRPWQERVPAGERNEALYIEAHMLREAGMPERIAIATLVARVRDAYDASDFPEREVVQTVRNAYKKGEIKVHVGWVQG